MMRRTTRSLAAIAVFILLSGFGSGAAIYNVRSSAIPPNPAATMENIEKAIMRAGLQLGWQVVPLAPGKMEGTLVLRRHRAVVDIAYDAKTFSISYKDSLNLDYDDGGKTIHSNYNGWIQNLEKAIRVQTSVL